MSRVLLLLLLSVTAWPVSAQWRSRQYRAEPEFSRGYLEYRFWAPSSVLGIRISDNPLATEISAKNDLGLKDPRLHEALFTYHGTGRSRFRVGYWQANLEGENTLSRTVIFGNTTYALSTPVKSKLELKKFELGYAFEALRTRNGKFQIGPLVKVNALLAKGTITAPALNRTATEDLPLPIPTVGGAMEIRPHARLHISGEFSALKIDQHGSAVDGDISIRSRPAKHLTVGSGYRYFRATPRVDQDYVHFRLSGFYVSGGLTW